MNQQRDGELAEAQAAAKIQDALDQQRLNLQPSGNNDPKPSSYCGDGYCNLANGETCVSCPQDCGACQQPQAQKIVMMPLAQEKAKPGVTHYGGKAEVTYDLSDGSQYTTTYDEQTLNYYIQEGMLNRNIITNYQKGVRIDTLERTYGADRVQRFMLKDGIHPVIELRGTNGNTFNVDNYMAFADTEGVQKFADFIKDHSKDDQDFIRNVLLIKSQVNTYTQNIKGEPRYPVETFLEGGGDCGASSIFVASMLKAAHPEWTVKVWYVNTDAISDASNSIDHMIVSVEYPQHNYLTGQQENVRQYIETTLDDPDQAISRYNGQKIYGWSFEIH
jgi:hypothetical protein